MFRLLTACGTIGIVAVIATSNLSTVLAVAVTIGVTAIAAATVDAIETRRVRQVTDAVLRWIESDAHTPLPMAGPPAWREATVALNRLGAAHSERGEHLARQRPWRRELVDSLEQPAMLFSQDGWLLAANASARALLGIAVDAADLTVLQAVGNAALADLVKQASGVGEPVAAQVEHGEHDLSAVSSVIGDQTLLMITDRTSERRVDELRRNFVVNASHELKTPVTSIQALAEALKVTVRNDPDRMASLVNRLGVETERLARLVRDLLDLRRLEERAPLQLDEIDLAELVRLTVAELIPRAENRQVSIWVEAPDRAIIAGIPGDVEVIVKNLVSNAVQYNQPNGTVEVTLDTSGPTVSLQVRDTGLGIPQQDLSRVFERFYRVDAARSRETGGTGLGLSIVRHAVERHSGTINVESLLGEGTTFIVTLPSMPAGDVEPGGYAPAP